MLAKIATGLAGVGAGAVAYLGYMKHQKTQNESEPAEDPTPVKAVPIAKDPKDPKEPVIPAIIGFCGQLKRSSLTGIPSKVSIALSTQPQFSTISYTCCTTYDFQYFTTSIYVYYADFSFH